MTRCQLIGPLLMEYVADELGPLERSIVDDHLVECTDCRAELATAEQIRTLAAELPRVECPDHVTEAITAAVDRDTHRPRRRNRSLGPWWRTAGAAGVVAAAVMLAVVLPRRPVEPTVAVATIPTAAAIERARDDLAWTVAYTAAVIDRSERRSLANVLQHLRALTPDSNTPASPGGQG